MIPSLDYYRPPAHFNCATGGSLYLEPVATGLLFVLEDFGGIEDGDWGGVPGGELGWVAADDCY